MAPGMGGSRGMMEQIRRMQAQQEELLRTMQ